ncbi:MAG: hypothetical protein J1F35_01455 [Erysipelotrichales bacterium]|nr:hypothetical protein [Erysipelotrichales bacterium]
MKEVKIKEEKTKKEEVIEEKVVKEKKRITPLYIIKLILLIITSPIWFPWKVLFVRRPGKKFKDVSIPKKIFRILRAPITKTIKFALFLFIIAIEISLLYKVRYSPVTYTITRSSVHNYYLQGESSKQLLGLVDNVYASNLNLHYDEFKEAFDNIDTWSLGTKNKMYVILDADVTKIMVKYIGDSYVSYILTEFNTNESFRNDIEYIVKNINKILTRFVRELPEALPYEDLDVITKPLASAGSVTVDYKVALDALGTIVKSYENEFEEDTTSVIQKDEKEMINLFIKMVVDFGKGKTIAQVYEEATGEPLVRTSSSNKNATVEIIGIEPGMSEIR